MHFNMKRLIPLVALTLTIASCGGKKRSKSSDPAPAPVATSQDQSTAPNANARDTVATKPADTGSTETDQGSVLADPTRTDFKINKSCDASKVKPSESLPIEIKIKACLHLRTDSSEANAVTKRCGEAEDNIKEGNVCTTRPDVKGMCRILGKEFVLDYYPTDGGDWEQFCTLIGGEAIEL